MMSKPPTSLTDSQKECIMWLVQGYDYKEIGKFVGLSDSAVRVKVRALKTITESGNDAELIYKLMRLKLIK